MSITTKFGDKGQTKLFTGQIVSKSNDRIKACGDIDELVSIMGIAKTACDSDFVCKEIDYLQRKLFVIASEIASEDTSKLPKKITEKSVNLLTARCKELESKIILPKDFIVPGSHSDSIFLDWCRAVARRCERDIVLLKEKALINNIDILIWFNRLSDYLYLLGRSLENNNYKLVKDKIEE